MNKLKLKFKKQALLLITCVLSFSLVACNKQDKDKKIEKSNISAGEKSSNNIEKKDSKEQSNISNEEKKDEAKTSSQSTTENTEASPKETYTQPEPVNQPAQQTAPANQPAPAAPTQPAQPQQTPEQGGNQEGCLDEAVFN